MIKSIILSLSITINIYCIYAIHGIKQTCIKNHKYNDEISTNLTTAILKLFTTQENVNNKTTKAIKLNSDNISELTSILDKGK